jgi:hypothetical protein
MSQVTDAMKFTAQIIVPKARLSHMLRRKNEAQIAVVFL